MSWMTPQLLTAVAPLFNLGGKLLAQSGKVDAGKSLAIMGTVLGAAGSIAKGIGPAAKTGTPLIPGEKEIGNNFAESMKIGDLVSGGAVESVIKGSPSGLGGMLGAATQGKTDDLMKLPFGTNLQELVSPSQDLQINKDVFSMFQQ